MGQNAIVIKGAREHNPKDIDLSIPRDELVVITGLSGSGKSSLAFDTMYAEGQRRYVESLSSYARQFLGQMDKPDVDFIEGLSPAVSIDQKSTSRNPRSTVGTVTEIYDYLRLLWANIGTPHCPKCGKQIHQQTIDQLIHRPMPPEDNTRVPIPAPAIRGQNGEHRKVNDKCGNPIESADVIVWRVENTAKALFDVDDYNTYVHTQSETALRHVATTYAYDQMPGEPEGEITLRSNIEEVSEALKEELAVRLEKAGVVIDDARLTHLAYAPEIAQAMLRRQQAEAVIAAREKIVQGAVSMVDMALAELSAKNVVGLDDERQAAMVSNLLVVLCGNHDAQPVVNSGSLY